jgi:hypothetical protein
MVPENWPLSTLPRITRFARTFRQYAVYHSLGGCGTITDGCSVISFQILLVLPPSGITNFQCDITRLSSHYHYFVLQPRTELICTIIVSGPATMTVLPIFF